MDTLAKERLSAGAAAQEAASRLQDTERVAAEDREKLQQQIASLEQNLNEATAIQEDLAIRLQACLTSCDARSETWPYHIAAESVIGMWMPRGSIPEDNSIFMLHLYPTSFQSEFGRP